MRFNLFIVLALVATLFTPLFTAESTAAGGATIIDVSDTPLTQRAEKIVTEYDKGLAEAAATYAKAVEKAKSYALRDLERESVRETRGGQLTEALRIKVEIQRIQDAHATDMLGNPISSGNQGLTPSDLFGKSFTRGDGKGVISFDEKGNLKYNHFTGTFAVTLSGRICTIWGGEAIRYIDQDKDGNLMFVYPDGKSFSLTPVEKASKK